MKQIPVTLIDARDRGGLWKVNKKIQDIFMQCELFFRSKTANFITAFVCSDFINGVMKNIIVTSNFNAICTNLDVHITQEMQNNLLEHILTLFVRVRTFSFAKDIRKKHKIGKKQLRKRLL